MNYIAVVKQPAVSNVFIVKDDGSRERLEQHTHGHCEGFAYGYSKASGNLAVRFFECSGKGDATGQDWKRV